MIWKEFFPLLAIRFRVAGKNGVESIRVFFAYYLRKPSFAWADLTLLFQYLFRSPFRISKKFLHQQNKSDIYVYGETPLTTIASIARAIPVTAADTVFELGVGRGRTAFWLQAFTSCRVVGIEWIPEFVEKATKTAQRTGVKDVQFLCEDFVKSDLSQATIIYLYGSNLENETLFRLAEKFCELPSGTWIVTVSFMMNEYRFEKPFPVVKTLQGKFPWGTTDIYIQKRL